MAVKFPDTKLRTLQLDSFFIESVKHAPESKRQQLSEAESYHIYSSDVTLHKFLDKATMDTKFAILAKLGFHYALTTYDDTRGCDRLNWMEQICAARGRETSIEWFEEGYSHESHSYIIGSLEVNRVLNRLDVMYHSKMFPITRYIKRMRDFKKLASYEALWKQQDFIYFILKACFAYSKFAAMEEVFSIDKNSLLILIIFYFEHRQLRLKEITMLVGDMKMTKKLGTCLNTLVKLKYIDKSTHQDSYGTKQKNYGYLVTEEGVQVIRQLCLKILQYI